MKEKLDINDEESRFKGVPYTEPIFVEEYQSEPHPEFERGWEKNPAVWQGNGKLVEGGKLYSDGFSQCSAFVIKNPDSRLGGLFHIQDIDFEVKHQKLLREFFLDWLDSISPEPAEKEKLASAIEDICFYRYPKAFKREEIAPKLKALGIDKIHTKLFGGDTGRYFIDNRLRTSLLEFLGVNLPPTSVFQDYHRHWAIIADFDIGTVKINIPYKQKVLEYDF